MGLLDGLLGSDMSDPKTMATLQLAAGLMGPGGFGTNLGKGLLGYQGSLANDQDLKLKAQQIEQAKQAQAMQMMQMQMLQRKQDYLFGTGATPGAAPQAQQPSVMAGAPGTTPQPGNPTMGGAPSPVAPAGPQLGRFGLPIDQERAEIFLNDGKDMAKMMQTYNTPVSFRPGGWARAPNGQMMQFPVVPEGYTAKMGDDGAFHMIKVDGGPEAVAVSSGAKASGQAGYKQTEVIGPGNVPYKVFNKNLPGFGPTDPGAPLYQGVGSGPSAAPAGVGPASAPGGGNSPLAPVVNAAGHASVPPAAQAATARSQLALISAERAKEPPGPSRDAIDKEIARLTSVAGLPPGAVQTGLAPGTNQGANNAQDVMKKSYESIMGANNSAQTVQARLDEISKFSKVAILGGDTQWRDYANNLLSIAGISDRATDRKSAGDLLEKNASQIALAIGTGTQGTDGLRALAGAANPNRHMTQAAIDEAVAQLQASAKMQQAKAQLLTPHFNSGDTAAYNTAEQNFDKNADYRLWQLKSMTPQQAQAYRAQLGEAKWAELKAKAKALPQGAL